MSPIRRVLLAALGLLALSSRAVAVEQDFAIWPGVQTRLFLTDDVHAGLLLQLRLADSASRVETAVVRGWLGAKLLPWLELAGGYDFIPTVEPVYIRQQRIWPQVTLFGKWSELAASNRTRLEFRFIEGVSRTAVRIRNGTRFQHPIGAGPWYAAVADEFFFNLNDAPPLQTGFAENRLFLGLGRSFGAHLRAETGYQMRYVNLSSGDRIQHTLMLTLFFDAKLD